MRDLACPFTRTAAAGAALLAAALGPAAAGQTQFSWDGDCGSYWHECCVIGADQCGNNWTVAMVTCPQCPVLPGANDDVSAAGSIILTGNAHTKNLSVAGSFTFDTNGYASLDVYGDLSIFGSIFEPTTFRFVGGPFHSVRLINPDTTASISSGATVELHCDAGFAGGQPGMLLTNHGTIMKLGVNPPPDGSPATFTNFSIPVNNHGYIGAALGTISLNNGGTNHGVIEAIGGGEVRFVGPATYVLDGEVRGTGTVRFANTYTGGSVSIVGDYHPASTVIAGGHVTVNFDVNTSIENLHLDNAGHLGGIGRLTVDHLTWYGAPTTMHPGPPVIVQQSALFKGLYNNLAVDLQRDMDLHGNGIVDTNSALRLWQAELRNHATLELRSGSGIHQVCCAANAGVKNFGTLLKTGGGTSLVNVGVSNDGGTINVASGTLELDGQMSSTGDIIVAPGAVLRLGFGPQSLFPQGSITGDGTVRFAFSYYEPIVDLIEGTYTVATTEVAFGTAQFENSPSSETLNMTGGLLTGAGEFTATELLNWSAGTMSGPGTTTALGQVLMSGQGYLQRALILDCPDPCTPPGPPGPPGPGAPGTLHVQPGGVLGGDGILDGSVSNNDLVAPGSPVGTLRITGNYAQQWYAELAVDLAGPSSHDQLVIAGNATLAGALTVNAAPGTGASYTILTAANVTGTFSPLNLPEGMTVTYTPTSVILQEAPGAPCPADFDHSGDVGITDLLALLAAWGSSNPARDIAPPGGDGIVNIQDLLALLAAWGACP